jgi:Tetratricopeptide repeat.
MSQEPNLFISFSSRDQSEVRKLFFALEIQNISFWDYSDEGQELPLAHELDTSLKEKIDSSEYFIAIITPHTIDEQIGRHTRLEVRYAIDRGKVQQKRILPVLLNSPSEQWLSLYPELQPILHLSLNSDHPERFEDTIRRICQWMSVSYIPSSLKDPRVFFARLFLEEAEGKQLNNADFVQLMRIMNSCANRLLDNDWAGVKEKVILFLNLVDEIAPDAGFYYPLVIKGVSELQLKELENARQTFLQATENHDLNSNPLLRLGFAGLGHAYFSLERYNESLEAFQKSLNLQSDDQDVQFNYLGALIHAGGIVLDEAILDGFDLSELSLEDRIKVITLKGAINYKRGSYYASIRAFRILDWNDLDEASAIYYSLALQESGAGEEALSVLCFAANKIKSTNLYHHLADAYLKDGDLEKALSVYEDVLCSVNNPSDLARQILIEYAQIIRRIYNVGNNKFHEACEKVINFNLFPPPQSKADCFFTGFAYYLLGRKDLAKHYYDNSLDFSSEYYDEIEL